MDIIQDSWLPGNNNGFIRLRHPTLLGKTFDPLVIVGERIRDIEILRDLFDKRDFNLILQV